MPTLTGYSDFEEIRREGDDDVLYCARRDATDTLVLVRVLRPDRLGAEATAALDRVVDAHRVSLELTEDDVVHVLAVVTDGPEVMVVSEDFPGIPLTRALSAASGADLALKLRVFAAAAATLARFHSHGFVHRDIRPEHVLVRRTDEGPDVRISGLGLARRVLSGVGLRVSGGRVEGSLPYMSPEQTGRTSHDVDQRSDLYALGVCFFEVLGGRLPFDSDDPMEIIHGHVAREPPPLVAIDPDLPQPVSDLVARLLAKAPEDRYATARGLFADLDALATALEAKGTTDGVVLTGAVAPPRVAPPSRNYGRAREIAALSGAVRDAAEGSTRVVLLEGPSGVGKTALASEIQGTVVEHRCLFASATCAREDAPCAALVAAVRALVDQILSGSDAVIARHRQHLAAALGRTPLSLLAAVPELGVVMSREETPTSRFRSERERLPIALARVAIALAIEEPVVLFLDDFHHADDATLAAIQELASAPDHRVLALLSRRSDDGADERLASLARARAPLTTMTLGPLGARDVLAVVADVVHADPWDAQPLAEVVLEKTGGNPLFIHRFLRALGDEGHLFYDEARGQFTWDLVAARAAPVTDNVGAALAGDLAKLPERTRRAVAAAACLGSSFDLASLSALLDGDPSSVGRDLRPAAETGVIVPTGDASDLVGEVAGDPRRATFRFCHERVRTAAYELCEAEARAAMHARIGQRMLSAGEPIGEELLAVAHHLNVGVSALSPSMRERLCELDVRAAAHATTIGAHQTAAELLAVAVHLLPPDAWDTDRELAERAWLDHADALFRAGDRGAGEAAFSVVLATARAAEDRARGHVRLARARLFASAPADAARAARTALLALDVPWPDDETAARELEQAISSQLALGARERIAAAPPASATEEIVGRALAVLEVAESTVRGRALAAALALSRAEAHGRGPWTAAAAVSHAAFHGDAGELSSALEWADAAIAMAEDDDVRARVRVAALGRVLPWRDGLAAIDAALEDALARCHERGDTEAAGDAYRYRALAIALRGRTVPDAYDVANALARHTVIADPGGAPAAAVRQACASRLLGLGGDVDVDAALARVPEDRPLDLALSLAEAARVDVLLGEPARALSRAVRALSLAAADAGALSSASVLVPLGVAAARVATQAAEPDVRAELLDRVDACVSTLASWADASPDGFLAYSSFLLCERARALGDQDSALLFGLKAIERARRNGYVILQAQASQALAELFHERDRRLSRVYIEDARSLFARAGATAVVQLLEGSLPDLSTHVLWADERSSAATIQTFADGALDLAAVLKASQAISREINLEPLLSTLLRLLAETAGAERSVLITEQDGAFFVEADFRAGQGTNLLRSRPLGDDPSLPRTAITYVARTGRTLVAANAAEIATLRADPAVQGRGLRSLLCMPVAAQGRLVGLVYLENNLASGVFTPARCRILEMLASQAAISLVNARLVETLESRVRDRTRALSESLALVVEGQQRLAAELAEAAAYVRSLLPPPFTGSLSLDWRFLPSAELGGDALGYHRLPDGRLAVYVLDVCGHGMASALLSIAVHTSLAPGRLPGVDLGDPAAVLSVLNTAFPSERHGSLFFTIWYGVLDPARREISFSSAGHPAAVLFTGPDRGSLVMSELMSGGPMIGVFPDAEYVTGTEKLGASSRLFVFSDGLYEIVRQDGSLVPYEDFLAAFEEGVAKGGQVLDRMVEFARSVRGTDSLDDDLSMVEVALDAAPP